MALHPSPTSPHWDWSEAYVAIDRDLRVVEVAEAWDWRRELDQLHAALEALAREVGC